MSEKVNVSGRLNTDTAFIKDLIAQIKKGEIKIPQFQRKFVWRDKQALELLDSIANNYPVGSLLLWKTTTKLSIERNIGDFTLPETADLTPTEYVLDGQQRITVIYSCLGAPVTASGFAAGYDLETQEFIPMPEQPRGTVFPMRLVFDTTPMLNFRTGLQTIPQGESYQPRLDQLIAAFTNYRLPVVTLKELSVEEVCPIFERINSAGTKLSIFDLMVAATWSPTFDLNALADEIAASLEAKDFDKIEETTVLKCLGAVKSAGLKRDQLMALRKLSPEELAGTVSQTKAAMLRAVDLLHGEFKIYSWDFLPYEAVLIVLCFVCSRIERMDASHHSRLRQWFWRSAFNERYRVGGEGFVTRDLQAVLTYVQTGAGVNEFGSSLSDQDILKTTFRSSNSRSRAFVLALAAARPRNITNAASIDTAEALSQFNKKEFHHIFPKAYLKRSEALGEVDCIANICMLAASENKVVSDSDPHEYLPNFVASHQTEAEEVLVSNLLPNVDYKTVTYGDFLLARAKGLAAFIERLCNGEVP